MAPAATTEKKQLRSALCQCPLGSALPSCLAWEDIRVSTWIRAFQGVEGDDTEQNPCAESVSLCTEYTDYLQ